jgi:hypothetical protein|tara:strand:- start:42 stop:263 length:222 start_codon:yes stop_codon:yes gene_type:complete
MSKLSHSNPDLDDVYTGNEISKIPNCIFEFVWNGTVCIATRTNSSGEYVGIELYDYASKALLVYIPFKKEEVK